MWLCVRPGRERRLQHSGVHPGGQVSRRRRGDPQVKPSHWLARSAKRPPDRQSASSLCRKMGLPWVPETGFQDEAAATFTMVAGWNRFRPRGPTFTATSQLSAWTKLGRGPGNLRDVGKPDGGRSGLATVEMIRTAREAHGVAGTRFAERHGYSNRVCLVAECSRVEPKVGGQVRERRQRRSRKVFTETVHRGCGSPRRSIERRRNRPGSECDPTHVR